MPIMSGEICLSKLKELESFNTPVIALTADALAFLKIIQIKVIFQSMIQI